VGIVSYAQNFEDVMLWRALGHVPDGFWIDVGAADPNLYSVTRAFSERGWRGVNIEPTREFFARLTAARPREINLNIALGASPGRATFYECDDATLSSLDPAMAARNRADGRAITEGLIEVTTVAQVCRQHAPADIHFLKIDVEGAEAEVIAGADFATFRPWIVLVEATVPLTQTDASAAWEPALLAAGYRFAWFDGLNRFYVATERQDALAPHFRAPPNVFDQFTLHDPGDQVQAELALANKRLALLRAEAQTLHDELEALRTEAEASRTEAEALRAELTPRRTFRRALRLLLQLRP
jgi:FkbM family methyltransferase